VSFASENTLLMEQLASHGYVVISIRDRDQAAEYATVQAGLPKQEQARDRELLALLKNASSAMSGRGCHGSSLGTARG
jgi:hypothetical protein